MFGWESICNNNTELSGWFVFVDFECQFDVEIVAVIAEVADKLRVTSLKRI